MIQIIQGHNDRINSVAVTPDGKFILSASNDRTVRLWRAEDATCIQIFRGHSNRVNIIAVTPDSQFIVSGSKDCTLKLWNLQNGDCLRTFKGHSDTVNTVAISVDGSYAVSGSSDCDLRRWDIRTGECLQIFKGHPACGDRDGLNSLIRSSNSEFSYHDFIGNLGFAKTYNEDDFNFFGHADPVTVVALSPNGRFLLSGSEDNTLRLWNIKTGECFWIFGGHNGGAKFGVHNMAVTPNGKYVISASETLQSWRLTQKKFRRLLWGIMSERPYRMFKRTNGMLGDIAITPAGKHIAVIENDGGRIGIYKIRSGNLLRSVENSSDRASAIAVTPDGRLIVAGSISGVIRTWELS